MKYILILEDNRKAREALVKAVRGIGGNIGILEAETEEEARSYLFDYRIDVFILDIILTTQVPGDVSGIRFAEKVRKIESYLFTPIIFITALADPGAVCLPESSQLQLPGKAFFHERGGRADYYGAAPSRAGDGEAGGVLPERRDPDGSGFEESNPCGSIPPYTDDPYGR